MSSKRELTPDEQAAWDSLVAQVEQIDQRLNDLEQAMADDIQSEANSISRLELLRRSNSNRQISRAWIGNSSAVADGEVLRAPCASNHPWRETVRNFAAGWVRIHSAEGATEASELRR